MKNMLKYIHTYKLCYDDSPCDCEFIFPVIGEKTRPQYNKFHSTLHWKPAGSKAIILLEFGYNLIEPAPVANNETAVPRPNIPGNQNTCFNPKIHSSACSRSEYFFTTLGSLRRSITAQLVAGLVSVLMVSVWEGEKERHINPLLAPLPSSACLPTCPIPAQLGCGRHFGQLCITTLPPPPPSHTQWFQRRS
jgi:hypothetical protein